MRQSDPTKESGNRIDYWREKAFEALDTLRQANDNCERLEAERDALRKKHRAFLQHLIDAEKYDAKFGLTLPGDSALAALINSAMETLERPE